MKNKKVQHLLLVQYDFSLYFCQPFLINDLDSYVFYLERDKLNCYIKGYVNRIIPAKHMISDMQGL